MIHDLYIRTGFRSALSRLDGFHRAEWLRENPEPALAYCAGLLTPEELGMAAEGRPDVAFHHAAEYLSAPLVDRLSVQYPRAALFFAGEKLSQAHFDAAAKVAPLVAIQKNGERLSMEFMQKYWAEYPIDFLRHAPRVLPKNLLESLLKWYPQFGEGLRDHISDELFRWCLEQCGVLLDNEGEPIH